jgi:hypothetical protein
MFIILFTPGCGRTFIPNFTVLDWLYLILLYTSTGGTYLHIQCKIKVPPEAFEEVGGRGLSPSFFYRAAEIVIATIPYSREGDSIDSIVA